jgi:hypothetical protein
VAILVRRSLIASGEVEVPHEGSPAVRLLGNGRLITIPLAWRGHSLSLTSVYMPNGRREQVAFMPSLKDLVEHAGAGRVPVWGGDWNSVEDIGQDRSSASAATVHSNAESTAAFRLAAPGMVDLYRLRHPGRRGYSHFNSGHKVAARLDRYYAPKELLPSVTKVDTVGESSSDHRPVVLHLAPMAAPGVGRGLARLRMGPLWQDTEAREAFSEFQLASLQGEPAGDAARLGWWEGHKSATLAEGLRWGRVVRQKQQQSLQQQREAARAGLAAAYEAAEAAQPSVAPLAVQQVLAAQQTFSGVVAADWNVAELRQRQDWLHAGERPSPAQTAALQGGNRAREGVPAIRDATTGALQPPGRRQADLVAEHWARVSSAPVVVVAAQLEVLQALAKHTPPLTPAQADRMDEDITEQEVGRAVKRSNPTSAPGEDGLPVEVYQRLRGHYAPVMARVFASAERMGALPPGFLDGVITIMHKAGDKSNPANYRPLTLLNTDYRVLAKLLGARLQRGLGEIIDGSQTAFLAGRRMGHNVLALQALPAVLPESSRAIVAHLDIAKAYDTVDRGFLVAALRALGGGTRFVEWVKLLLGATRARATVNGFLSRSVLSAAGVRQGCPFAPTLYLVVGQALHCYLRECGLGIMLPGAGLLVTLQFADDVQVLLESAADAPVLEAAMGRFKQATGQGQCVHKAMALPVGRGARADLWAPVLLAEEQQRREEVGQPFHRTLERQRAWAARKAAAHVRAHPKAVPPGLAMAGMRVVDRAKALGIELDVTGAPVVDWGARVSAVGSKYSRLARMGLSVFGKSFGAAAYGISKLLQCAELAGAPPPEHALALRKATARLVAAGQGPGGPKKPFHAISHEHLLGHPREGGFGMLALPEHVRAREAVLLVGVVAAGCRAGTGGAWGELARLQWQPRGWNWGQKWAGMGMFFSEGQRPDGVELQEPLRRLVAGFRQLPPLEDVALLPLQAGPWRATAPLFGCPFITPAAPGGGLGGCLEGLGFRDLAGVSCLQLVGDVPR